LTLAETTTFLLIKEMKYFRLKTSFLSFETLAAGHAKPLGGPTNHYAAAAAAAAAVASKSFRVEARHAKAAAAAATAECKVVFAWEFHAYCTSRTSKRSTFLIVSIEASPYDG
jgi:hypothetical protein